MSIKNEILPVGQLPPIGHIPEKMYAWTLRSERLGDPVTAYKQEIVKVPEPEYGEVIIANVAAGLNYNCIWAATGKPVDVIKNNGAYGDKKQSFHICGSEASGIVYAVGEGVKLVKVGDRVTVIGYRYDPNCPFIKAGGSPVYSPTYHVWGYEGNWGAFSQFSKVSELQCIPLRKEVSWIEGAGFSATGLAVHRMLTHWQENKIKKDDIILIWGGSGGIGTMAIQEAKYFGALPIAVVSSEEKGRFCMELGAVGYINRRDYHHWGDISKLDPAAYKKWMVSAIKMRNQMFNITGQKRLADIVIEHPGSDTLATSLFLCAPGGMVALCGATTGYIGTVDLRYLWMNQKRLQGSHVGTREEAIELIELMAKTNIRPIIQKISWNELPEALGKMASGEDTCGKRVMEICRPEYIASSVYK